MNEPPLILLLLLGVIIELVYSKYLVKMSLLKMFSLQRSQNNLVHKFSHMIDMYVALIIHV